jgi:hypothetical protein
MELNPSTNTLTMANVEAFALVMISFVELVGATPFTALAYLSQWNTVLTPTLAVTSTTAAVTCSLVQWLTDTPVSHAARFAPA